MKLLAGMKSRRRLKMDPPASRYTLQSKHHTYVYSASVFLVLIFYIVSFSRALVCSPVPCTRLRVITGQLRAVDGSVITCDTLLAVGSCNGSICLFSLPEMAPVGVVVQRYILNYELFIRHNFAAVPSNCR